MVVFIAIGAVGLGLVVASLVLGEILGGLFDVFDADIGGGVMSTPVIGAFLGAFGFGASLTMYATGVGAGGGALAGLASGLVVGGLALLITKSLMDMPTDETMRTSDLVGKTAIVVTRIPQPGIGEINVNHLGQSLKMNARANEVVEAGTAVEITTVLSSSAVLVKRAEH